MRSWNAMSSPCASSIFFALITGGMKAPSDGGLKMTMESFSSACACAASGAMSASATAPAMIGAARVKLRNPIVIPPMPLR